MLQDSKYVALIARYLNNPNDQECQLLVDEFRMASAENEAYFLEMERVWNLSERVAILDSVDREIAVENLKQSISPKSSKLVWLKYAAVAVFLLGVGYWIYFQNTKINYLVKTTAQNQVESVKLSDGSEITLAENSELKYPDKFDDIREVSLTKGQAFFKIAKDATHPFKVILNKSDVVVLGTSFNIKISKTKIDLGVITGRVFFSPYDNATKSILIAGQALSYDVLKKEFVTKTSQNANAWLTKELVFVETPLEDVCKQLTDYYGTEIKLKNNTRPNKRLNAVFRAQTLDQVLEILNETYNIKINKENNTINLITP